MAAWGSALKEYGSEIRAREYITKLYRNVPVLDSGACGSTTTFVQRGTRETAAAHLEYLYSKVGQEIAGKHFYRPHDPDIAAKYEDQFAQVPMITIADFGGRAKA